MISARVMRAFDKLVDDCAYSNSLEQALVIVVNAAETTSGLHEVFFKGKTCSCKICESLCELELALKEAGV